MWQKHLYNKNRFSVNKIEILNHYQRIQMASAAWKNRMGFTLVETLLVIVILAALLAVSRMTVEQLELNLPYEFSDFIRGDAGQYYCDYAMCRQDPPEDGTGEMTMMAAAVDLQLVRAYTCLAPTEQRAADYEVRIQQSRALLEQTQALIAQQQQMERELADLPAE